MLKAFRPFVNLAAGLVLGLGLMAGWWGQQAAPARAAQAGTAPTPAPSAECDGSRSIQVSGAATVNVIPDRVLLKVGVQSNGSTPDGVQADNMAAIQRVTAAVRALGVPEKSIATDYYLVEPVYANSDALEIRGYRIHNVVAVTLDEVSRAGAVLIAALKAGANEVQDVEFYTSQLRKYRDQARALAMQAAAEKAQALAAAGSAQPGCLLHVEENTWSYYAGSWWGGRAQAQWTQNVIQNAAGSGAPGAPEADTPLSLGQIAVSAQVNASYSLR